jgi:glycosyl transferase family 11
MVIVRLLGGLGNQMFQYAAGRRMALANEVPLKLDRSWCLHPSHRAYALDGLSVQEAFATPEELREIHGPSAGRVARLVHRLRQRCGIAYRWTRIQEDCLSPFDRRVLGAAVRTYLDGYWQSEKYFSDIADTIRREFAITSPPSARSRAMAEQIAETESVSVHVRRGDYVSNPRTHLAHGTCTLEYYRECEQLIGRRIADPHFFVFSDDPEWVAANLQFDHPATLVSHDAASTHHDDLRLMSLCRHHVIANSSFSWWGAWLNPRRDKLVLAPRRWGNDARWDDRDLVPDSWIRV